MNTKIEWADKVWNPVTGCSRVSEGCQNCYAERLSHRFKWTTKPWTKLNASENVQVHQDRLTQPLEWKTPQKIFVNSMSDLFHEEVPEDFIRTVFQVMGAASQHTFQILTKRPQRMRDIVQSFADELDFADLYGGTEPAFPWPNVWLGVSVENQQAADERLPPLLETPAAVRFLSCEPLLGQVNLNRINLGEKLTGNGKRKIVWDALAGWEHQFTTERTSEIPNLSASRDHPTVDWVIVGGESGAGARPMHPEWTRSLRDQCIASNVPFFFKQYGEWYPVHELRCNEPGIKGKKWHNFDPDTAVCRVGKAMAGRVLDGRTWDEFPAVAK